MKILSLLALALFFGKSCQSQNNDLETARILYTATSRAFYTSILVERKTIAIANDRTQKPVVKELTPLQWNALIYEFQKIELSEMPSLKPPTQKRLHDGAATASLTITYKGVLYESQTFDHGFPPDKIKNIVTTVLSFSNQKQ
jgi:hypothetical protein